MSILAQCLCSSNFTIAKPDDSQEKQLQILPWQEFEGLRYLSNHPGLLQSLHRFGFIMAKNQVIDPFLSLGLSSKSVILAVTWNREDELEFLNTLRLQLKESGHELFALGYGKPSKRIDMPQLSSFYSLDRVPNLDIFLNTFKLSGIPINEYLDEHNLLGRERLWHGTERDSFQVETRRAALYYYKSFYTAILQLVKPSLALIWNGQHTQEIILDQLCRQSGCPILYVERGPFKGSLQISPDGCTAGTAIAKASSWPGLKDTNPWKSSMEQLEKKYREGKNITWYSNDQPKDSSLTEIRHRLNIPNNKKVVLFTGQLDNDTSNFLYSPNFDSNLSAFSWLCRTLRGRNDVFILGKHHPLNRNSVDEFQQIVDGLGVWVDDVSLDNCFELADRVATVNSTTLFEALILDKPILTLGESLLSNKNIAYELKSSSGDNDILNDWIDARDFKARKQAWIEFGAYLLAEELYFIANSFDLPRYRDVSHVASKLISAVESKKGKVDYENINIDLSFMIALTSYEFWGSLKKEKQSVTSLENQVVSLKKRIEFLESIVRQFDTVKSLVGYKALRKFIAALRSLKLRRKIQR